jgi:hypothetical protein
VMTEVQGFWGGGWIGEPAPSGMFYKDLIIDHPSWDIPRSDVW